MVAAERPAAFRGSLRVVSELEQRGDGRLSVVFRAALAAYGGVRACQLPLALRNLTSTSASGF